MNIHIKRIRKKTETIDGLLSIDGMHICDTAENANAALPTGTYPITVAKCKQYSRKMLLLNPKPPCSGPVVSGVEPCPKLDFVCNNTTLPCYCPMLKPGNGVYKRLDGSIILGKYVAPGCLIHPKEAFETLYDRIRKNTERGNQVTLTITEDYPPERHSLTNFELGQQILKHF